MRHKLPSRSTFFGSAFSRTLFFTLMIVGFSTGCYTTRVTSSAPASPVPTTDVQWHFFYGLTGSNVMAVNCPNGLAAVETELPWWNIFATGATFGLVSATTSKYYCAEPRVAAQPVYAPQPTATPAPANTNYGGY